MKRVPPSVVIVVLTLLALALPAAASEKGFLRQGAAFSSERPQAEATAPMPLEGLAREMADAFPGLAGHLAPSVAFVEATRTAAGRAVAGLEAQSPGPRPPAGLGPEELEAWLAAAKRDGSAGGQAFRAFFPSSCDGAFVVEGLGIRVAMRALGASIAPAQAEGGRLAYRNAYPHTDSLHVIQGGRTEEFLLLRSKGAPVRFEYEILEVYGATQVRPHQGAVRFVDARGRGLEIARPWVVDARGRRSDKAARWELGPAQPSGPRALTLLLDPRGLAYPLVIDPGWSTIGSLSEPRTNHTATLLPSGKVLVAGGYNGTTGALASAELYDPFTGSFAGTGALTAARYHHTATLLQSGKVLVAGGYGCTNPPGCSTAGHLASAELYDPAAGTWSSTTGGLGTARQDHTATLLSSGEVLVAGGSGTGGALGTAEIYNPAAGTFSSTGSLSSARSTHTATLLASGSVLVAGGNPGSGALSSAEVYSAGSWTGTNAMGTARKAHTATLLPSGKVLVAGGNDGSGALASAESYEPSTGTWSTSAADTMVSARQGHTAALLPSGKVLVAGGYFGGAMAGAEIYDPDGTGLSRWSPAGDLGAARFDHAGTLLASGKVLMAGGTGTSGTILDSAEVYEPASGSFSAAGSLNTGRAYHTATRLPDGKILVAGGENSGICTDTAELYDSGTDSFSATGSLNTARGYHTATLLGDGTVLIAGGWNDTAGLLDSGEVYSGGTFTATTGAMSVPRCVHTATLLPDGRVLLAAGDDNGGTTNLAELYDPSSDTFVSASPLNQGRDSSTATLLPSGKVLMAGGYDSSTSTYLDQAELYDPSTDQWAVATSLPAARCLHTATLLPTGEVLLAGGYNNDGSMDSATLFDPAGGGGAGAWGATGSLVAARNSHIATLLSTGKVLIAGGNNGGQLDSAEVYDPDTGSWSATGSLASARDGQTQSVLPTGKVLAVGGYGGSEDGAELYDSGLGFNDSWRPAVSSVTSPAVPGSAVGAGGTLFTGLHGSGPEGSGGGVQSSATNYPLLQLRRLDNAQMIFLPMEGFSGTSFTSGTSWCMSPGPALATVFTSGIPSLSKLIYVEPPSLDAPANVAATTDRCTDVRVSWDAVTGATSYNVLRGTACGTVVTTFTGVTSPYDDTSAVAGTVYQYWVVAVGTCGAAASSACASGTRKTAPGAPANVAATTDRCTDVRVSWDAVTGATSYNVLRGTICGTVVTTFTGVTSPYDDTSAVAGTAYQYWVVAVNACGTSSNSACASGTRKAVPAAPGNVAATTDRCTDVRVSWDAVTGATSYNVLRGTACGTVVTTFTGVTSPYDDTSAVAGTAYQYWVVALNACGTSSNSACASGTRKAVPAAPGNVAATSNRCTDVRVSWDAVTGATSYNVLRGTVCGTVVTTFTGVTSPYDDTSAVSGTTYQYWVVALNACGTSSNSACASGTRKAVSAAPGNVAATTDRCTDVRVSWDNVTGVSSYNVLRGTICGTVVTTFTGVTSPYDDTNAVAGTAYQYWVVAVNACGTSPNSACASGTRKAVPAAPGNVAATTDRCTDVRVSWDAVTGATSYNVLRGTVCGTVVTTFTGVTSPYDDTSAVAGTAYQYWVVALNACGTSSNSACASGTRKAVPAAPAAPDFTNVTQTTLTVNWAAITGADSYDVWRATGSGTCAGAAKITATPVTGTSYPDSGLACNIQYSYYVVANNACGSSGAGSCAAKITMACPAPVPDGTTGDQKPFRVARNGDNVDFDWDVDPTHCPAADYQVLWGNISSLGLDGSNTTGVVSAKNCNLGDDPAAATNKATPAVSPGECYFAVIDSVEGAKFGMHGSNSLSGGRIFSNDTTCGGTRDTTRSTCP